MKTATIQSADGRWNMEFPASKVVNFEMPLTSLYLVRREKDPSVVCVCITDPEIPASLGGWIISNSSAV